MCYNVMEREISMTISIRLGNDIEERLANLAKMTGRTKSFYIREAVLEKLEDLEDIYIAERRIENPGPIWTMEEMEREIDLEN